MTLFIPCDYARVSPAVAVQRISNRPDLALLANFVDVDEDCFVLRVFASNSGAISDELRAWVGEVVAPWRLGDVE